MKRLGSWRQMTSSTNIEKSMDSWTLNHMIGSSIELTPSLDSSIGMTSTPTLDNLTEMSPTPSPDSLIYRMTTMSSLNLDNSTESSGYDPVHVHVHVSVHNHDLDHTVDHNDVHLNNLGHNVAHDVRSNSLDHIVVLVADRRTPTTEY